MSILALNRVGSAQTYETNEQVKLQTVTCDVGVRPRVVKARWMDYATTLHFVLWFLRYSLQINYGTSLATV